MKQQYKGSYTFNVASRTITLLGIEIPQERLFLVVNSTVGFVYHNFAAAPNADITISGGNTVIVFPQYKDCHTHRDTDGLSIFYDDGVDLGQLIQTESDETQAILQGTKVEIAGFRTEVKTESDETQAILRSEFDQTKTGIAGFRTEVKTELDDIQILLNQKIPSVVNGRLLVEILGKYEPTNDVKIDMSYGSYGMSKAIFSSPMGVLKTLNMNYDSDGNLVAVIPA